MPTTQPTPPPPSAQRKGWRSTAILEMLTKVILLSGPVFYVLGSIYSESYWGALGVPSSVMAVAAEHYIYYGFIVVASGLTMVLQKADYGAIFGCTHCSHLDPWALGLLGSWAPWRGSY